MKRVYYLYVMVIFLGCIDTSLEDISNETIPNFSITLNNLELSPEFNSNIIAVDDNTFITAVQDEESNIEVIRISQEFTNDVWELNTETLYEGLIGKLSFFKQAENDYLLGYIDNIGKVKLLRLDANFDVSAESGNYLSFIDTTYNKVDSIFFHDVSYLDPANNILLGGLVYTFGTYYSCVLAINDMLEPQWIKTYFEESEIIGIAQTSMENYFLLNNNAQGTELIRDNQSGSAYQKYNLSNDKLFFGGESLVTNDKLLLTGIHNDIGRTIEVDLLSNTTFVNEIENYPVSQFRSLQLSRNSLATAGVQSEISGNKQFSSELGPTGSLWCHKYIDETYFKILDIIELPGKGILISSVVERDSKFFLHLTRIDEEGATFVNEYTENCL